MKAAASLLPSTEWLSALALTLGHFLWQGVALAAVLACLLRALRHASASARHAVCLLTLLALLACPMATLAWLRPTTRPQPAVEATVRRVVEPTEPVGAAVSTGTEAPPARERTIQPLAPAKAPAKRPVWTKRRLAAAVVGAWAFGVVLLLARHAGGWLMLRRLRRAATPAAEALQAHVARLAVALHVRRVPAVWVSATGISPFVSGLWRPVLLVPAALLTGLPPAQVELILAHELAHLRRHDGAVNLLVTLAETLLFYHPAVWWTTRRLRHERECACDDAAVALGGNARRYASALARLAELATPAPALVPAALGGKTSLVRRIERLVRPVPPAGRGRGLSLALASAILLLATLAPAPPSARAETPARKAGDITDRNGVVLATTGPDGQRTYPFGALAAHVVGYARPVGRKNPVTKGVEGIEKTFDATLRPTAPEPARGVRLTLDARHQWIVEETLRESGAGRAAAVVLDCQTGGVLAMASVPSYDLGLFSAPLSELDWAALRDDDTTPLLNRAMLPQPPGSAFKVVTALAASAAGGGSDHHSCDGDVMIGNRQFKCWIAMKSDSHGHGDLSMAEALTASCNVWFYEAGLKAGLERIGAMGRRLGCEARLPPELPIPSSGSIPTEEKLRRSDHRPGPAETANAAIGQGMVEVSPAQVAGMMATVATGRVILPTLVFTGLPPAEPDLGVSAEDLAEIRRGLIGVVQSDNGPAKSARSPKITLAGKTGTAQAWRHVEGRKPNAVPDNKAWFAGFAPVEQPRYAFAIMVENGKGGGTTAAPIARVIMERLADLDAGTEVKPTRLEPAKGHFEPVEATFPQ